MTVGPRSGRNSYGRLPVAQRVAVGEGLDHLGALEQPLAHVELAAEDLLAQPLAQHEQRLREGACTQTGGQLESSLFDQLLEHGRERRRHVVGLSHLALTPMPCTGTDLILDNQPRIVTCSTALA